MENNLKDLFEKSNSLLKTEKLNIKPLERVLYESNNLLTKLNEKTSSQKDFMGETLLVQEGFNINNYLNSLNDINLQTLTKMSSTSPTSVLTLSSFLEKEESYLVLSSIEECKKITSNNFYNRINSSLNKTWKKEKHKKQFLKEEKYNSLTKQKVESYSCVILHYLQNKELLFHSMLKSIEKQEICDIYHFLSCKEHLKEYLENHYNSHILNTLKKSKKVDISNLSITSKIQVFLNLTYNVSFKNFHNEEEKWRVLYYMLRIGQLDEVYIKRHFEKETHNIYNLLFNYTQIDPKDLETVKKSLKFLKNIFQQIVYILLYKIKNYKLNFTTLKIEDYLWFKIYLGESLSNLKETIKKCGIQYFNNDEFLFFKLLLYVEDYNEALKRYKTYFPNDIINYIHFSVLVYLKGYIKHQDFYVLIHDYSKSIIEKFGLCKDSLVYHLLIKDPKERIKYLKNVIINNFTLKSNEDFNSLICLLQRFLNKEDVHQLFNETQEKLSKNGKIFKSIILLFVLFEHFKDYKFMLKVLQQLTFLLNNAITNNEYDKTIIQYSELLLRTIETTALNSNTSTTELLNCPKELYSNFLIFLKLYKFFNTPKPDLYSIQNLNLLPFRSAEIAEKVNSFLNYDYKIRSCFSKLLTVTLKILNEDYKNVDHMEKQKRDNLKNLLTLFLSKIQHLIPVVNIQ